MKLYLKYFLVNLVVLVICFSLFIGYNIYGTSPDDPVSVYLAHLKERIAIILILTVVLAFSSWRRAKRLQELNNTAEHLK